MSEADGQQEESPTGGGSTPGANADDDNDEGEKTTDEEDEEEEETKVEDPPEVKELKERISELESTLTEKKSSLQYNLEKCEEYSKSGYARKVAEMENMKRVRSVSFYLFLNQLINFDKYNPSCVALTYPSSYYFSTHFNIS